MIIVSRQRCIASLLQASWKTLERKEEDKRVNLLPPFLMNGWPGKSLNSFPIVVNVYLKIKRGGRTSKSAGMDNLCGHVCHASSICRSANYTVGISRSFFDIEIVFQRF